MARYACAALFCLVLLGTAAAGRPRPPPRKHRSSAAETQLIIFGDSLTDQGNALRSIGAPNTTYYWQGRSTNTQGNWVDAAARALGSSATFTNLATAAASLCAEGAWPAYKQAYGGLLDLSLEQQVSRYINSNGLAQQQKANKAAKRVALVWIASNDWVTKILLQDNVTVPGVLQTVQDTSACLGASLTRLATATTGSGKEQKRVFHSIYVMSLPPLEGLPIMLDNIPPAFLPQIKLLVDSANNAYVTLVQQLAGSLAPVKIASIDVTTSLRGALVSPPKPINDTTTPCLVVAGASLIRYPNVTSLCTDPSTYAFYDDLHPTSAIHAKVIAPIVLDRLVADGLVHHPKKKD